MNLCPSCGVHVVVAKDIENGVQIAFDSARSDEALWTLNRWGQAQRGGALVPHVCDPLVLMTHEHVLASARLEQARSDAYTRACPTCGAKPDEPCLNQIEAKRYGRSTPTKNPHTARFEGR